MNILSKHFSSTANEVLTQSKYSHEYTTDEADHTGLFWLSTSSIPCMCEHTVLMMPKYCVPSHQHSYKLTSGAQSQGLWEPNMSLLQTTSFEVYHQSMTGNSCASTTQMNGQHDPVCLSDLDFYGPHSWKFESVPWSYSEVFWVLVHFYHLMTGVFLSVAALPSNLNAHNRIFDTLIIIRHLSLQTEGIDTQYQVLCLAFQLYTCHTDDHHIECLLCNSSSDSKLAFWLLQKLGT